MLYATAPPLDEHEILTLQEVAALHSYADFRRRALGLLALQRGHKVAHICELLQVSEQPVYNWVKGWRTQSLAGILDGHKGGAPHSQAIGRSRGGLSTKIHATVDALDNPTGFHLTPGHSHDLQGAAVLLEDTPAQTVIADKAYDVQARLVESLLEKVKAVVIASRVTNKRQREYDRDLYKARHLIENFFAGSNTAPLPRATTRLRVTFWEPSIWPRRWSGSHEGVQSLEALGY